MSQDPITMDSATFERKYLDQLPGMNPKTRQVLETLPTDRDTIVTTLNQTIADLNEVETQPFVVFAAVSDLLTGSRLVTDGANITFSIATAGQIEADLTNTAVTADTYGAGDMIPAFTVDEKGRITAAMEFALISANVTETTKLFFTNARALAAVSVAVPPLATSPGIKGQIATSPGFFYQCVATNTWERVATATF